MPPIRPGDKILWKKGKRRIAPSSPLPVSASSGSPRVTCTAFSFAVRRGWLAPVSWRIFLSACASAKDPRAAAGVPVFSNALGNGDPVDPDDVPVVVRLSAERPSTSRTRSDV